jgi:hypothetical protein
VQGFRVLRWSSSLADSVNLSMPVFLYSGIFDICRFCL